MLRLTDQCNCLLFLLFFFFSSFVIFVLFFPNCYCAFVSKHLFSNMRGVVAVIAWWVRISIRVRCTALCDKVCQWLATDCWVVFSCPPVSSTNKTDRHDVTALLLKLALNTIKQTNIKHEYRWLMHPNVIHLCL